MHTFNAYPQEPIQVNTRFEMLYPDVDPRQPLPATFGERLSLTVAIAVLTFGAAAGDLTIGLGGLGLTLLSLWLLNSQTRRRVRAEARHRFPDQPWAEYEEPDRSLRADVAVPVSFALLTAVIVAALRFVPDEHSYLGAGLAAIVAAIIVTTLPGLSPLWSRRPAAGGAHQPQ